MRFAQVSFTKIRRVGVGSRGGVGFCGGIGVSQGYRLLNRGAVVRSAAASITAGRWASDSGF